MRTLVTRSCIAVCTLRACNRLVAWLVARDCSLEAFRSMVPQASRNEDSDRLDRDTALDEEDSPLDFKQTAAIWFTQLAQGVYITLPYTLAVYMVRHFEGSAGNEESIGRNTGLLAATASAAQCMTSFLWGTISDRIGRKPVLMVGNISAALSILALGVAPNYSVAIMSRFIGGLFTSSTGVAVKTIIAESCDATNQAKAMGYMLAGWGVGTIVGPTIGGLLARPCTGFASGLSICDEGTWFAERPFLLPCLFSAVLAAMAFLSNLFMMSETHPRFKAIQYAKLGAADVDAATMSNINASKQGQKHVEEVQMSTLLHKSPKARTPSPNAQNVTLLSSTDRSLSVPVDATGITDMHQQAESMQSSPQKAPDPSSDLTCSQSARHESQLQLSASGSSSSSSGILAVRSASSPVDLRSDHDRHKEQQQPQQAQHAQRASFPRRAPSFELVLPDSGGESDMGAYPAALEVAAKRAERQKHSQANSPAKEHTTLQCDHSHSGQASDDESETEGLLAHIHQTASQDIEDCILDIGLQGEAEKPWYKQRIVTVCLGAGGLIVLFMNYLDELAPIFASAPQSAGGLGMPENEFAWPLTFGGVVLMLYSLFFYPQNQKRWGQLNSCKIGLIMSIPASFVFPAASMFANSRWVAQAFMFTAVGIRSIAKIQALSSSTIIVNTVAPMKQIGAVNGASQTLNALARAIGPFIAGIIWGYSADSSIPGKQYFPFLGSVIGILGTYVVYMFIVLPPK